MKYKGVVFDLDGTLVNSLEDITDSMNRVLQRYGFLTHSLEAYKYFIGKGIQNLVRMALPEKSRNDELISRCFEEMLKEYRNHCLSKTKPYPGISELLDELAERKIKLAVFSNKVDDLTKKIVLNLLPHSNFELIIGASAEIPAKPNPIGAWLISEKLGVRPENFIYLGDSGIDMQTAKSAGMYAVGALWGLRTKEELISNGAKYLLGHPMDLIKILSITPHCS